MRRLTWFRPLRDGMTLVELLVVITIIGMLMAIATPALVRAVARGHVTSCSNNEYQVAFALMRYDEQHGSLPGWLNRSPSDTAEPPSLPRCSWPVMLLPFLSRNDIYDMWPQLPNNPSIDVFICPANRPTKAVAYPIVHYAGNAGATGTVAADGIFLNGLTSTKTLSLDQVADADGTSTTLAFAEKSSRGFAPHAWLYTAASSQPAGGLFGSGTTTPPVFGAATPPGPIHPVVNRATPTPDARSFAPASAHSGGAVVAFCDGHVMLLREDVQPYVYGQLLTPKSRWSSGTNATNSAAMQPWLLKSGTRYLLDESVLRP